LDVYQQNGSYLSGDEAVLKNLDRIAWRVANNPRWATRWRAVRWLKPEERYQVARDLAEDGWLRGEVAVGDSNAFGNLERYVCWHFPKACTTRYQALKHEPLLIVGSGGDDWAEWEPELADQQERPQRYRERAPKRRANPSGRRARSHGSARANRWPRENREIERVDEELTIPPLLMKTSLEDVVLFAILGLAEKNQKDAAKVLGMSQQTFSRRHREARERFYERYYDPPGTGERVPKLHR